MRALDFMNEALAGGATLSLRDTDVDNEKHLVARLGDYGSYFDGFYMDFWDGYINFYCESQRLTFLLRFAYFDPEFDDIEQFIDDLMAHTDYDLDDKDSYIRGEIKYLEDLYR